MSALQRSDNDVGHEHVLSRTKPENHGTLAFHDLYVRPIRSSEVGTDLYDAADFVQKCHERRTGIGRETAFQQQRRHKRSLFIGQVDDRIVEAVGFPDDGCPADIAVHGSIGPEDIPCIGLLYREIRRLLRDGHGILGSTPHGKYAVASGQIREYFLI